MKFIENFDGKNEREREKEKSPLISRYTKNVGSRAHDQQFEANCHRNEV